MRTVFVWLSIVVAVAENGVIGHENRLPWRLKTDLAHFKRLTIGRPILMGRRNWDSIGRPLPGRETIVLTRDRSFSAAGVQVVHDWPSALRAGREIAVRMGVDEVAVVGGAEIYRLALPDTRDLHLTIVHASPNGDVRFPEWDLSAFTELSWAEHPAGPDDEHPFTFVELRRTVFTETLTG